MDLTTLPFPCRRFIESINNRDSKSLAELFSEDCLLIDESKHYRDHSAIRSWSDHSLVSHEATILKILDVRAGSPAAPEVQVLMDGDFVADYGITEPFPLWLHFTLPAPGSKEISRLRIDTLEPGTWVHRAVWAAKGLPEAPLDALRCDVLRVPTPPEGWVRVKMTASSLNYHDVFTLRGVTTPDTKFPVTLGNEGVGTLEDGTEVLIYPVMSDRQTQDPGYNITVDPTRHVFGEKVTGLMSEYALVPAANLVPKPADLPVATAAVLGCAWLAAYRMLFALSGLRAGQRMLVQGSTGGIATGLIQMGVAAGFEVWATGRTAAKRDAALRLGAHRVFSPDAELPGPAHAVFNLSGAATWDHAMASVANGGVVVLCAIHGGAKVELDIMDLFVRGVTIKANYMGTMKDFKSLVGFVAKHKIEPLIDAVIPLEEVRDGLGRMIAGDVQGKIVVQM